MYHRSRQMLPDLLSDPFGERTVMPETRCMQLLGAQFHFDSNSRRLMRLVDSAYGGLPRHRLPGPMPRLRVRLQLSSGGRVGTRSQPAPLAMLSGGSLLGGATDSSDFVMVSPPERTALVCLSRPMLGHAYHARYERIEFAVFTLATRAQGLVPLHAACVGRGGRGILLMGPSGAGKSTVALLSLLQGLDFLSEDSVFVAPDTMRATGLANFLHVRADSLRWLEHEQDAAALRNSPVIRRRSGVRKFELDLRDAGYRLAAAPLKIAAIIFLSPEKADEGSLLRAIPRSRVTQRLTLAQAYAAGQPQWAAFCSGVSGLDAFELRRGRHPLQAVDILRGLLRPRTG
jgi:hypothetical protein